MSSATFLRGALATAVPARALMLGWAGHARRMLQIWILVALPHNVRRQWLTRCVARNSPWLQLQLWRADYYLISFLIELINAWAVSWSPRTREGVECLRAQFPVRHDHPCDGTQSNLWSGAVLRSMLIKAAQMHCRLGLLAAAARTSIHTAPLHRGHVLLHPSACKPFVVLLRAYHR